VFEAQSHENGDDESDNGGFGGQVRAGRGNVNCGRDKPVADDAARDGLAWVCVRNGKGGKGLVMPRTCDGITIIPRGQSLQRTTPKGREALAVAMAAMPAEVGALKTPAYWQRPASAAVPRRLPA